MANDRITFPPFGKSVRGTFQSIQTPDLYTDDVVCVTKEQNAPKYVVGTIGDPHPDTTKYPTHVLTLIEPSADGNSAKWTYTRIRDPLVTTSMTEVGQRATTTISLIDLGDTPPTLSALTLKAEDLDLSNGKAKRTITLVPDVFSARMRQIGTPLVIPERFRAATGVNSKEDTIAGTVGSTVALGTDEVERVETQKTKFVKTVRTTTFDPDAAPTLHGQQYDEQFDVVIPYEERLEASGTSSGDARTEITPLSSELDLVKTVDPAAAASVFDSYVLAFPGTANLQLPDVLESITVVMQSNAGDGYYNESGDGYAEGKHGSLSLSVRGNAQASGSIIPGLIVNIRSPWGRNIPTAQYLFFMALPVTAVGILTRLSALAGTTVQAFPKFSPVMHTMVMRGENISLQVQARGESHTSFSLSDSASEPDDYAQSRTQGSGYSKEVGVSIREVKLPPTIHGYITVGGQVSLARSLNAQIVAGISGGHNFWGVDASRSLSDAVDGSVTPTFFAATANDTSIPTSGLRLLSTHAEPYRYGYAKVFCETVNFADVS